MSKLLKWYSPNATDGHNEEFYIKDGFIYQDNLSEQLDSMTVVVPHITKRNFEPFDKVRIKIEEDLYFYFLIDDISESQITFDEEPLYDYTLSLMSLTKELERIVLPNFSITRRDSNPQKTLKDVIEELLEDYSPKAIINEHHEQIYTLTTNQTMLDKLNIDCPEMQMSKPTLREALDKVLSVIDCICKLNENNQVEVFEINKKTNAINPADFNYKNENQSSSDYASELENNYNNVTPNKDFLIKNYTLTTDYIGFRNTGSATMADNTVRLETSKPIYLIKKVVWKGSFYYYYGDQQLSRTYVYREFDITNYIYEKQAFDILPFDDKNISLYYSRGSNIIDGWNNEAGFWIFQNTTKERLAYKLMREIYPILIAKDVGLDNYLTDCMFEIEYYAQEDNVKSQTNKYLPETHENNVIIDNPSSAYVDIKQQGRLFNQKVNRLGNRVKILTGRFDRNAEVLPTLGDYLGDFIVMNRELQYYDDFINIKLTLTENFTNINYFTGINARRRSWQIEDASSAFDKQLLDKWYCEFSFEEKLANDNEGLQPDVPYNLSRYFVDLLDKTDTTILPVMRAIIKTPYTVRDDGTMFLELDMSSYIAGDSFIFSFSTNDNKSIGLSLGAQETGGIRQEYNDYVDANGENEEYHIMLLNSNYIAGYGYADFSLLVPGSIIVEGPIVIEEVHEQYENLQTLSKLKPRLYIPDFDDLRDECVIYETGYTNHKDNREKIGFNIQFQFCSDNANIVVGKKFLEYNKAVQTGGVANPLKIYYSPKEYRYGDNKLQPDSTWLNDGVQDLASITLTNIAQASTQIDIVSQVSWTHKSFAICDYVGNLILAINTTDNNATIYLNLLKTRDRKNYTSKSLLEWE